MNPIIVTTIMVALTSQFSLQSMNKEQQDVQEFIVQNYQSHRNTVIYVREEIINLMKSIGTMLEENKNFKPRMRKELTSIQIDHLLSIFNALSKSISQKEFLEALDKTSKLTLTVQSYCQPQEHSQDTLRKLSEIQENLTLLSKRVKQTDFNAKL